MYQETNGFGAGTPDQKALQAQIIGADGAVTLHDQFFQSTANGFLNQSIYAGNTLIFGIQAIKRLSLNSLPQNGIGWRGTVSILAQQPGTLIATVTQRLICYSGEGVTTPVINACGHPVPTFVGGTAI